MGTIVPPAAAGSGISAGPRPGAEDAAPGDADAEDARTITCGGARIGEPKAAKLGSELQRGLRKGPVVGSGRGELAGCEEAREGEVEAAGGEDHAKRFRTPKPEGEEFSGSVLEEAANRGAAGPTREAPATGIAVREDPKPPHPQRPPRHTPTYPQAPWQQSSLPRPWGGAGARAAKEVSGGEALPTMAAAKP
mmetsp:Transcript_143700/g.459833  ORF Transcript_143700/g.459833 Transcript_143700/m.459833 type:complete len:193 (-) Transcript_143700:125-703(-)